jgi:magnesium transporter
MRELTLGLIRPMDAVRVWLKEASVGLLNGAALGALIAAAAWAWKGNPYLGGVVGAAMAINTLVAVSLGGVVPLLLKRIRVDPALASGPILTTVTDMCGFALVLGIATAFLPWLGQS